MKKLYSVVALFLLSAGECLASPITAPERLAVESAIKDNLRDPTSASFKHSATVAESGAYCGLVNSKNGFGGYAGFSPFIVMIKRGMDKAEFAKLAADVQRQLSFLRETKVMVV